MSKISLSMVSVSAYVPNNQDVNIGNFESKLLGIVGKGKRIAFLSSIVGTLSEPSKMPTYAYSIPAKYCITGSKLRLIANSTCSKCYALKGRYIFPNVMKAMEYRFNALHDMPLWKASMIELIRETYAKPSDKFDNKYFRWHDSGDVQSIEHLKAIADIAKSLPDILFWLPTREYGIVGDYLRNNCKPENLTIRLSAHMVGKAIERTIPGTVTSSVDSGIGDKCKASKQGNMCLNCRDCWHVNNVDYVQH
jgi:hypothetical protein